MVTCGDLWITNSLPFFLSLHLSASFCPSPLSLGLAIIIIIINYYYIIIVVVICTDVKILLPYRLFSGVTGSVEIKFKY